MKLVLNFISADDERKPVVGDDVMYLTNQHWYIDEFRGDFIPADVTHWAKIDMGALTY